MKRSESITIKTTEETKKALENIAAQKEWTLSQLCNKILTQAVEPTKSGARES